MTYPVKCMHCRARRCLPKPLADYKRVPVCKNCGSMTRHARKADRRVEPKWYPCRYRIERVACRCEGAYHFPAHRKGSPMCIHNPNWLTNRMARSGDNGDADEAQRRFNELMGLAA